jgi:excisionase family DNA binding protein
MDSARIHAAADSLYAPPPCFLTIAEAAHELRCSKTHLERVLAGKVENVPPLPVLRIGRRVLIRAAALKEWALMLEAREDEAQRASGRFALTPVEFLRR